MLRNIFRIFVKKEKMARKILAFKRGLEKFRYTMRTIKCWKKIIFFKK